MFRFSVGCFLGVLILDILISPFMDRLRSGPLIEATLSTVGHGDIIPRLPSILIDSIIPKSAFF